MANNQSSNADRAFPIAVSQDQFDADAGRRRMRSYDLDRGDNELYGVIAEYDDADQLVAAAHAARAHGYRRMDAYSPFPIHGLDDAIGFRDDRLPWLVFFGGIAGALTGYLLQYYTSVIDYPLNVGGRPLHSWPQWIPVTFEATILFAAFTGGLGMFILNGLPRLYHSVFNAKNFERATQDRFFLCIESDDRRFDRREVASFLRTTHGVLNVSEVER